MLPSNNAVDSWIYQVGMSHSGSTGTEKRYRLSFERFCASVGKTAEEIIEDYEKLPEKTFKRFYAQAIVAHMVELKNYNCASGSIATALNSIRSFFKYNSLPLNFIPAVRVEVENHNRDIQNQEIAEILRNSDFRERAFFSLVAQTGLRPDTLTKLKIGDFEDILESYTPIPCLIKVGKQATKGKYDDYFTFAPKESVTYLKEYFKTRKQTLTEDSYVFAMYTDENKPVRPGVFSHLFRRIVMKLQKQNVLSFKTNRKAISIETKNHKPLRNCVTRNELRLYNLRKFFRKYAGQAGPDFVNFWMGHLSSLGVDLHYFSRDVKHHRQIFKEKAMPFLRLETATPTEAEKQIADLRKQLENKSERLETLETRIAKLEPLVKLLEKNPDTMSLFVRTWLEKEENIEEAKAKWNQQDYKKKFNVELTQEQIDILQSATDDASLDLAKALQKALNLTIKDLAKKSD
ncbi:MAG: tyrosine-type recombinase/integrase [Candidatus Bathyarchaeota archaeon]|nr:tyrosine-type recombinase/integrase [Candidatus Bathyarchaeota archaeon]